MALVLLTLALAVRAAVDQLSAAGLVPQDLRDRAVARTAGNRLYNTVGVSTPLSVDSSICSGRVQIVRMDQGLTRDWPIIRWLDDTVLMGALTSNLQATSTSYTWGFHPGYEGNCQ
jgi:hypothetical protein